MVTQLLVDLHGLIEHLASACQRSGVVDYLSESVQRVADSESIPQCAPQRKRLLVEGAGAVDVSQVVKCDSEIVEGVADIHLQPELAVDGEALLVASPCGEILTEVPQDEAQPFDRNGDGTPVTESTADLDAFLGQHSCAGKVAHEAREARRPMQAPASQRRCRRIARLCQLLGQQGAALRHVSAMHPEAPCGAGELHSARSIAG